ncbi:Major Facilitator Superfamily protein [Streptoalloteichus tenebrarius]|uniref:Major Facilitator Superfamily protein n=1 Tax=Streptoalloteichus tenebrarius (strain ATCC 17920 / DSM 40477 / JCM 4838 / CBS 697.72 / NBRC 16177 / NCIMB 11028 / NRRL B-12390 / A12253. 1 / ISP 5477) TaxID=1933 RepID=A0ABT1HWF5_STRSD|nr:MFS transporter [Streptoalloteichus tenebrarius]MCP2259862.1 Major Facilitator Superfamily protein [Streptoalloteichus tenebrarius]
MTTTPQTLPTSPDGVLSPAYRARTLGIVLTVSLVAFESLGVATILPDIARDLDGLGSYGWGLAAMMLANIVGTVVAGHSADRRGPRGPLAVGLVVFALGCVLAGSAPTWPLFLVGRFAQGLGVGAVMAMAYTLIGLVYPERLRARMFALLSSAWTVPSLIGPVVAAAVTAAVGWRWTFLLMLPLTAVAALLTLPGLTAPAGGGSEPPALPWWRRPLASSLALTVGTGVLLAALQLDGPALVVPLAVVGFALGVVALRAVTPAGTLTVRRGVAAGVVVRFLLCAVYFGTEAFLPLGLTELQHVNALEAGLGLSAGALTWVAGSAIQARWDRDRVSAVALGFGVLLVGVAVLAYGVLAGPGLLAVLGWAVGGVGMGIAFNAATTETLGQAPAQQQGAVSAALQLAQTLATAMISGLGGALVGHQGSQPSAFLTIFVVTGALSVAGLLTARRVGAPS